MEQNNKEVIEELQKIINKLYSEEIYAIAFYKERLVDHYNQLKY